MISKFSFTELWIPLLQYTNNFTEMENNNSKFECRFCNGFGKYLNKYIVESTAECYKSRIMGEGELKGLSKKIFEII